MEEYLQLVSQKGFYSYVSMPRIRGDTADVLEAWQRLIGILNVKGPGQDERWNNKYLCVLRHGEEPGTLDAQSEANIDFLLQMGAVFRSMAEDDAKTNR